MLKVIYPCIYTFTLYHQTLTYGATTDGPNMIELMAETTHIYGNLTISQADGSSLTRWLRVLQK